MKTPARTRGESGARPLDPPPEAQEPTALAVLPRGPGEELRVALDRFNGFPFVSLRVWAEGPGGEFIPLKGKGLTIKVRELAAVAAALTRAAKLLGQASPAARPKPRGRRGDPARADRGSTLAGLDASPEFDEFAGG